MNNCIILFNVFLLSAMSDEVIKKLESTAVMHKVLRYMCSQSGRHGLFDGWGILQPWEFLYSPEQLSSLIEECTKDTENIKWNGRNL